MEDLVHSNAKRDLLSVPLGIIYLSNPEFSSPINFNFNQYFVKVVDIALTQLTLNDYYVVPIPLNIDVTIPTDTTQLAKIKATIEKYPGITYYIFSAPTSYIDIVFEAYFRYEHSKILICTGSSQIGANYVDNVIRILPNDYSTVNFIANLYLPNTTPFDIIFLPGEFIDIGQTLGYDAIASDIQIFNEYLKTVGNYMLPNPYNPSGTPTGLPSVSWSDLNVNMIGVDNLSNPNSIIFTSNQQFSSTLYTTGNTVKFTNFGFNDKSNANISSYINRDTGHTITTPQSIISANTYIHVVYIAIPKTVLPNGTVILDPMSIELINYLMLNGNPYSGVFGRFTNPDISLLGPQFGNPDGVSRTDCIKSIQTTLDSGINPDYYTTNYYGSLLMQYQQNPNATADFLKDYPYPEIINWILLTSYYQNKGNTNFILCNDTTKISYLGYLLHYITFFDYSKEKHILLILAQFQFPAIQAALNYFIPIFETNYQKPGLFENFKKKVRFILTNVNNRDEFTYTLFTDPRTNTLWYNAPNGKTWYDLTVDFPTSIIVPRTEQTIFVLLNKMSQQLNLRVGGKPYDISNTTQPSINALYNGLSFINHFVKNNVQIENFILSYFLNTNLLQFGNNLQFNNKMDNIYDISVSTSFFYSGEGVINRGLRATTAPCTNAKCSPVTIITDVSSLSPEGFKTAVIDFACNCPGKIHSAIIDNIKYCWNFDETYWKNAYGKKCTSTWNP